MAEGQLNEYGLEWDPPVYKTSDDAGNDITVLGWSGMTEDVWESQDGFELLPVERSMTDGLADIEEGVQLCVALPEGTALKEGFIEMTPDGSPVLGPGYEELWSFFSFNGDRLEMLEGAKIEDVEMKGSYDFREYDRRVRANGEQPIRIGKRCLADYGKWLGGLSPLDAVTRPYERFLESMDDIIKEGGVIRDADKGLEIVFGNPRMELADVESETERPYGMSGNRDTSCFHNLYCSVSVREVEPKETVDKETGKKKTEWVTKAELFRTPSMKVAAIPAMNMKTGLFLYNGDEYSMAMYADPNYSGLRIETAGMAFRDMLKAGLKTMGENLIDGIKSAGRSMSEIGELLNGMKRDGKLLAGVEFERMFSGETDYSRRWRRLGEGEAGIAGRMRAPMTVLTPAVKVQNDKGELVDSPQNDIKPQLAGIVDFLTSPSGKNITESACLGMGVRIDDKGVPYLPCYRVSGGKVDRSKFEWIPVHAVINVLRSKNLTEGMQTMDDYVVAHPDDVKEDGESFFLSESGKVLAKRDGGLYATAPEDIELVMIDRNCSRAPGANANTDRSNQYEVRTSIQESNVKGMSSAMPGSDGATFGPHYSHCDELGFNAIARAEFDGTVTSIVKDEPFAGIERWVSMTVMSDDGRTQTVDMRERRYGGDANVYRSVPTDGIEEGVRVVKGQPLTDTPGVVNGEVVIGTPAIAAFVPMGARATDDCILISESFAKKLAIERRVTKSVDLTTGIGNSPYGPSMILNPLAGADPSEGTSAYGVDCSRLGPDGIIRDGELVQPGDVIAFTLLPDGTLTLTVGEQRAVSSSVAENPLGGIPKGYEVDPALYEGKASGHIKTRRESAGYEGTERLEWDVVSKEELVTGDKLSIDGVKGVVQVIKDEEMPRIAEGPLKGHVVDMALNATSYLKRLAPGTMIRGLAALMALCSDRRIDIPNGTRDLKEAVMEMMAENGFPEDGRLKIVGNTPDVDFGNDGMMRTEVCVFYVYDAGHRVSQALVLDGKALSNMKGAAAKGQGITDIIEASHKDRTTNGNEAIMEAAGVAVIRAKKEIVRAKKESDDNVPTENPSRSNKKQEIGALSTRMS